MKKYIDITFLKNPVSEYLKWLLIKTYYQLKYWGTHLRIGYGAYIYRTKFGRYNHIGRNVFLTDSQIGDFTYISYNTAIVGSAIGKFCSIGPDVKIGPGRHPTKTFVSTHPALFAFDRARAKNFVKNSHFDGNLPVVIGNDVWIGANAVILDGVKIGNGAIIAANSVVTRNAEPYSIVAGIPAKTIKKRFGDGEINYLEEIKWWDKGEKWIQENIQTFLDVKDFVKGDL